MLQHSWPLLALVLVSAGCRRQNDEAERRAIDEMVAEARPELDRLPRYTEQPTGLPECRGPLPGPVLVTSWHRLRRGLDDKDWRRTDPPSFAQPGFEDEEAWAPASCGKFDSWIRNAAHGKSTVVKDVHACIVAVSTVAVLEAEGWQTPRYVNTTTFEGGHVHATLRVFQKDGTALCSRSIAVRSGDEIAARDDQAVAAIAGDLEGRLNQAIRAVIEGTDGAPAPAASPSGAQQPPPKVHARPVPPKTPTIPAADPPASPSPAPRPPAPSGIYD